MTDRRKDKSLPSFRPQIPFSADASSLAACAKTLGFNISKIKVTNPELRKTSIPYIFPNAENSSVKTLRRKFDFSEALGKGDEYQDQLAIARWVRANIYCPEKGRFAGTVAATNNPIEILELSRNKAAGFWCSHFSIVFPACANAAGFVARSLGVDSFHTKYQDSTHHGTSEIYSTLLRKWYLIDTMHGCLYLKKGVPLNAYEIAEEWLDNQGKSIRIYNFLDDKIIRKSNKEALGSQHESSAYYFFKTSLLMDPFHRNGNAYPERSVFFRDKKRSKHTWYAGPGGKTGGKGSYRHPEYSGAFLTTSRIEDFYFDVNTVNVQARPMSGTGSIALSFETFTPNFSKFLYRINRSGWKSFSGKRPWRAERGGYLLKGGEYNIYPEQKTRLDEVAWKIKRGLNVFEVKPLNLFKKEGAVSRIEFHA